MTKQDREFLDHGLADLLTRREAVIGVIGLGYVGLPLAAACARGGFRTVGFDIDRAKVEALESGRSYVDAVASDAVAAFVDTGHFSPTIDLSRLASCDVIVICVPTPLTRHREPDLTYVTSTAEAIRLRLRPGQLVVLESTTFPGTTEGVVKPILERGGLRSGVDFFLGFSPEREDPGNVHFQTASIPKVAAGDGPVASALVQSFYGAVVERVVAVSSPAVAEAVKITENVFRAVNIALVNELKVIYQVMGIDVWEVIDAAATKPFGYMPFYPGPGLGGHCIPIDPFYLSWKSREFGVNTRFIELAGEINVAMPRYVVSRMEESLDRHLSLRLGGAHILIIGLAYKKNVSDIRESPTLMLMELLEARGTRVDFYDPYVPDIPHTREHGAFTGRRSVVISPDSIAAYDAILIATDHDCIDYEMVAEHARMIIDTRNAISRRNLSTGILVKA